MDSFQAGPIFLVARFVGSWLYIIFRSEGLFVLLKCIFSSDEEFKEKFQFSISENGDKSFSWRIRFSLVLRAITEAFLIIGSSVSFVLLPSWSGLMADVSTSLNLIIIDDKIYWIIERFFRQIPGLNSVKHTVKYKGSARTQTGRKSPSDGLRGAINMSLTLVVVLVIWLIDIVQTNAKKGQPQPAWLNPFLPREAVTESCTGADGCSG